MTSNPLTTGKARKFVPDMPQDNYPAQRANAFHALRIRLFQVSGGVPPQEKGIIATS
jgi:hypothetical protein